MEKPKNIIPGYLEDHGWAHAYTIVDLINCDKDLITFRRFERLAQYQLLHLQGLLAEYTNALVQEEEHNPPDPERIKGIVSTAAPVLKKYNEALIAYERLSKLHQTPSYVQQVLKDASKKWWQLSRHFSPGDGWDELSSIVKNEKGALHRYIDNGTSLKRRLPRKQNSARPRNDEFYSYSEAFLRLADNFAISVLVAFLLAAPVATLFVRTKQLKVAVVIPCTLAALCLSSLLTEPTQRNRLTFVVAYAAFVVAFLGGASS